MSPSIILLRSMDMLPDPRVEKYVCFYKENKFAYQLLGWNRAEYPQKKENTFYFDCPSHYGEGVKNLKKLLRFNVFLFKTLWKRRATYQTIHACDIDTVMPALIIKLFFRKNVIFDIFDWYSESRLLPWAWLRASVHICERMAVRFADHIILCDKEREHQIPFPVKKEKLIVLPNIPSFEASLSHLSQLPSTEKKLIISYVGILGRHRGLEDLLNVVSKRNDIRLIIAGFGELESLVVRYSARYEQIYFAGKVVYTDGLALMKQSDMVVALYYKTIRNHIYAAPNKYYEALFLGKPLLTTAGTLIGAKTEKYQTGYVIEEGEEAINQCLSDLEKESMQHLASRARRVWREVYQNLWKDTIDSIYRQAIS